MRERRRRRRLESTLCLLPWWKNGRGGCGSVRVVSVLLSTDEWMYVWTEDGRTDVKLMLLINWIRGRFRRFLPRPTRKKSDMDERADGRGRDLPRPVGQTDLTSSSI